VVVVIFTHHGFFNKKNMSGRRPGQTSLEIWIRGYLKQKLSKTFNRRAEAKFIEKAIMLINIVFGHPCCDDPENVVNLITPNDNDLTHTVRQLLHRDKIIRREYRLSLFRILDLLNDFLYGECCTTEITLNYSGGAEASGVTAQFYDLVTGDFIFSTTSAGGVSQSALVPSKYFGAAALISVQLTVLTTPVSPNTYELTDSANVYIDTALPGITKSNVFNPLQPVYTINLI
jgi:hypothetical protein